MSDGDDVLHSMTEAMDVVGAAMARIRGPSLRLALPEGNGTTHHRCGRAVGE